ncbi:MAG: CoA-binding protein [Pseudomonadota bacterium]
MNDKGPSDATLRRVLRETRVIAAVGVSPNPVRPSHYVGRYLAMRGYRVIPVNPGHVGKDFYGEPFVGRLSDLGDAGVDMVDIFRRSDMVPPVVEEALAALPDLRTVWMQIGVQHPGATAQARDRGKTVIADRCPKIEYQRLFGELRKGGFNTGIISSRLPDA